MTVNDVVARTPRYVLLEGDRRLGPELVPLDSGVECSAIYGFSEKRLYDRFCGHSDLALRPYPLVEGYLRSQEGDSVSGLKLIVLDANGLSDRRLAAATFEAVLLAQENRLSQLPAGYELILDQQADAYRLAAASAQSAATTS